MIDVLFIAGLHYSTYLIDLKPRTTATTDWNTWPNRTEVVSKKFLQLQLP